MLGKFSGRAKQSETTVELSAGRAGGEVREARAGRSCRTELHRLNVRNP